MDITKGFVREYRQQTVTHLPENPNKDTIYYVDDVPSLTTSAIMPSKYIDIEALKKFKEKLYEEIFAHPTYEHKCSNCGGTVEIDIERHIFHCPYCHSIYAIGTNMINSK